MATRIVVGCLILSMGMLVCCSGCDDSSSRPEPERGTPAGRLGRVVSVEFTPDVHGVHRYWRYTVTVHLAALGQLQEVRLQSQAARDEGNGFTVTVVEHFDETSDGIDIHTGTVGDYRVMRLYPATVAGVDAMNGFAMLPQNLDGSLLTDLTFHPQFNESYTSGHSIGGSMKTADLSAVVEWTLDSSKDGVLITVDGVALPLFVAP